MKRKTLILVGSVTSAHLFFFCFNFKNKTAPPKPKQSIVVHTYTPPPPPKPQEPPPPQQAKKAAPQKITPSKNGNIFKEIEETLAHIETKPPPPSSLSLPQQIQSLQIDHQDPAQKTDYFATLAQSLKEGLELPEQGEVKLELTVGKNGQVMRLHIVHALSEANRRYLELNLPKMKLPPFSEELKHENAHTFTLTFCNAS